MANVHVIEIDIILNGETIDIANLQKNMKIDEVRQYINSQNIEEILNKNFVFLRNNNPLTKTLEKKLPLEKIIDNKRIFIALQENDQPKNDILPKNIPIKDVKEISSNEPKNFPKKDEIEISSDKPKNIPIKGSIEIQSDENSSIKYYQYPNIEFTSEEEDKSKVVLLVGKTGDGKSTFINALVNIYLGIQLEDNFRYLLINDKKADQQKSVTTDIKIYKIRPKEGLNYPLLKIIDTPGFGDTSGKSEDMKHIKSFQNLFETILMTINCICFIVKASDIRIDPHQEYILNCVMNLFAENTKENFMVGVTNFIASDDSEIPNIISEALSKENNFYYENILKKDNVDRQEILNSNWYFASNNTTIIKNITKINNKSRMIWEETNENIKKFITKISLLESKNIKESFNIIKNREELKIEIEGLTVKMEKIILSQKRLEENQKQNTNILYDIKEQEKVILDIQTKLDEKKKYSKHSTNEKFFR